MRNKKERGLISREVLSRDWFAAMARLLDEAVKENSRPRDGIRADPFPTQAINRMARLAESLSHGNVPPLVTDVNAGGRPGRSLLERRDIAVALSYVELARKGTLADGAFIKTVSEAFG